MKKEGDKGENDGLLKIKKVDDKIEDVMKKEESSTKTDDDKKRDEKKEKFGNQVKGILDSFKKAGDKEEIEKDKKKEEKKVEIKGILSGMKDNIHKYHDEKNNIDKGVDDKGKKFQNERAKEGLNDIKTTVGKYQTLKDQTINALKE